MVDTVELLVGEPPGRSKSRGGRLAARRSQSGASLTVEEGRHPGIVPPIRRKLKSAGPAYPEELSSEALSRKFQSYNVRQLAFPAPDIPIKAAIDPGSSHPIQGLAEDKSEER